METTQNKDGSTTVTLDSSEWSRKVTSRKNIFKGMVKAVHVHDVYDLHGDMIPTGEDKDYKNVDVIVDEVRVTEKFFGEVRRYKDTEVKINGKKVLGDIMSVKGDTNRLVIKSCSGAG